MNLTRKQVKAWLDIISNDTSREVLTNVYIDKYKDTIVAVATDSYKLVALKTDLNPAMLGKYIKREDIVTWYKLATAKDRFTDDHLIAFSYDRKDDKPQYPKWPNLIPETTGQPSSVALNATYLLSLQTLNSDQPLELKFTSDKIGPILANSEIGTFLIMPIKK